MGKTKSSDNTSDTNKKKDKQTNSSKFCQNAADNSDSDSDDLPLPPQVYPGTHWPLDATLELYINYDAVKEIRAVKPDFYPMLFYLTKSDYSNVARVVSKLPVIMDHIQARLDKGKGSTSTSSPGEVKPTTTPPGLIKDLKTAKKEILKLTSNMCLNQKDADDLLDWVKSYGIKRKGKAGYQLCEHEDIENFSKPTTRTQSKTEDKLNSSNKETNSDSKPVCTRSQTKPDTKSAATNTVKKPKKDTSPANNKSRPPTREEVYANINKMTAAQILAQTKKENSKQTNKSTKDKQEVTVSRKRGRPRKADKDEDSDSGTEKVSTKRKTKSLPNKSVSPASSKLSPFRPILPKPSSSSSKFNLSDIAIQHASDAIKDILHKTQPPSNTDETDNNSEDEWPGGEAPQPVDMPAPPFYDNFGPVPMCLYKVQTDDDVSPVNDSLRLVTPKIEIDNAEEDGPSGRCFVKTEVGDSSGSMLQSSSSVGSSSVSVSGLSLKPAPIIRTICTGPVCGGDNCVHEHSVMVQDCDTPNADCVMGSNVQEAKEAEPVIIIDD